MSPLHLQIPCASCGAVAMRIVTTVVGDPLDGPDGEPVLTAPGDGVATAVGRASTWLAASMVSGGLEAIEAGIRAGDVPALLRLDPEIVPLYCAPCGVSYCVAHWTLWDEFDPDDPSWYDETRGICPNDHERRVYD